LFVKHVKGAPNGVVSSVRIFKSMSNFSFLDS
jgi:hypothetical protein